MTDYPAIAKKTQEETGDRQKKTGRNRRSPKKDRKEPAIAKKKTGRNRRSPKKTVSVIGVRQFQKLDKDVSV
jgi:hypothetical protein